MNEHNDTLFQLINFKAFVYKKLPEICIILFMENPCFFSFITKIEIFP